MAGNFKLKISLKVVNEGEVVELIRRRYIQNKIYTAISDESFQESIPIVGSQEYKLIRLRKQTDDYHPMCILNASQTIFKSMCHSSKSQCCVLTGNSASGETESLKHSLGCIVNVVVPVQASLKSKFLQVEFESEGLQSQKISYYDNKKTVDLLLNPLQGLLPILDNESKMAKATDAALIKKCDIIHRKHPNYEVAKLSYPAFTIQHYAGTVTYVTLGFLSSNQEMLGASLLDCMQSSNNEFISKLFQAKVSATGSVALQPERMTAVPNILMQLKKNKKNPTIRHKAAVVQHLALTETKQARFLYTWISVKDIYRRISGENAVV